MVQGLWILEECADERFPYRLQIIKGQELWLVLRTQDRWPFNSLMEIPGVIEKVLMQHGITLHPSSKMGKYVKS